jgi:hypothetical protein
LNSDLTGERSKSVQQNIADVDPLTSRKTKSLKSGIPSGTLVLNASLPQKKDRRKTMSNMVSIQVSPVADVPAINRACPPGFRFTTEDDVRSWLSEINNDPSSPQAHLKPENRDLTREELEQMFPRETTVGMGMIDTAFDRTSAPSAHRLLEFLSGEEVFPHLQSIENLSDLIDTAKYDFVDPARIGQQYARKFASFDQIKLDRIPDPEYKKGKAASQAGGMFLAEGFSESKLWIALGNVKSPRFLQDRPYTEPSFLDPLATDEKGNHVLLVPLLALGPDSLEQVERIYHQATNMGVREPFLAFATLTYGMELTENSARRNSVSGYSEATARQMLALSAARFENSGQISRHPNVTFAARILTEEYGYASEEIRALRDHPHSALDFTPREPHPVAHRRNVGIER